ncbi:MAG TPA: helix-turn-helix transcriptional regulator [Thermoanaerobaculia bacterium]|jgi:transcriptional regulator with XRE-family HTH domain|nr:helix-turn-helix transcriptional regulator [Thermoanaerobaculia bacterium]
MIDQKKNAAADGTDDILGPSLGKILLRARRARTIKQEELARKVGINDATLRRIEAGQGARPVYVRSICEALGLSYEEVVTEALFDLWRGFHQSTEGAGQAPLQRFRDSLFEKFAAYQESQRALFEAYFEFESFVHFKMKWEGPA